MSVDEAQEVIDQLEGSIDKAQRVLDELRRVKEARQFARMQERADVPLDDHPGFSFGEPIRSGPLTSPEASGAISDAAKKDPPLMTSMEGGPLAEATAEEPGPRRPERFGHGAVNRIGEVVDGRFVAKVMEELGQFTRSELAEAMQVKPTVASKWISQFRSRACIDVREDDERGMVYLWRGGDIPLDPDLDIEEQEEPDPEPVTREQVRDFVVQTCRRTGEPVGIGAILTGVGGTAREVQPHIDWLIEKGVIEDVSPIEGAHLYDYVEPEGPGLAAESQQRRQREALRTHASNQVPGTGKQTLPNDTDARELVIDLRRAGCIVDRSTGGHWSVTGPDGVRLPMVPNTPSGRGVKDARARLKRAGVRIP